MKPQSNFKLYKGARLPSVEHPYVVITSDVHREDFACSEYHIMIPSREEVHSFRVCINEDLDQLPKEAVSLESIADDTLEMARSWLELHIQESLSEAQRIARLPQPPYQMDVIDQSVLKREWMRNRLRSQIKSIVDSSRSHSLRRFLIEVTRLPNLTFTKEQPIRPHTNS